MKTFFREFREFALRGNAMTLAVGMIIGLAFQGVITSLTDNILSPIIGLFVRQNFDALEWSVLGVTLHYGAFITAVLNFIILAFVVFLIVRGMNRLFSAKEQVEEETEPHCPFCFTTIHEGATRCPACTSAL
ncbi:MAG: large conductance mechanosensitive channel protein MscL [Oscillospiraceae bacterium]|nr:large conductance mechanosensitive channel protein MscL [Oscillospiraceae bacterium]